MARGEARTIFDEDPELSQPQHRLLAHKLNDFWQVGTDLS
jgi:hypothetical protein